MLQEDLKRSTHTLTFGFSFLLPLSASLSDKHPLTWWQRWGASSSGLPSYQLRIFLPKHPVLLSDVSVWALTGLAHPALGAGGRVSPAKPHVHWEWEGVILQGCWATQTHVPTINGSSVLEGSACRRLDQPSQFVRHLSLWCPASCPLSRPCILGGDCLRRWLDHSQLFRPQLGAIDFSLMS